MKLTALLLMTVAVAAVILAMVQANRDDVLSRIAKTDPGRITWDAPFVLNACLFAVVPLITLLATERSRGASPTGSCRSAPHSFRPRSGSPSRRADPRPRA
jgi:hypothetical protein